MFADRSQRLPRYREPDLRQVRHRYPEVQGQMQTRAWLRSPAAACGARSRSHGSGQAAGCAKGRHGAWRQLPPEPELEAEEGGRVKGRWRAGGAGSGRRAKREAVGQEGGPAEDPDARHCEEAEGAAAHAAGAEPHHSLRAGQAGGALQEAAWAAQQVFQADREDTARLQGEVDAQHPMSMLACKSWGWTAMSHELGHGCIRRGQTEGHA
mmetsp:Transcript_77782/g.175872  ORF Transcript_77782/g.175872 Transcript_77782/m.175872 type:complete len:210 (+) Transcript_77782:946-1575(+)